MLDDYRTSGIICGLIFCCGGGLCLYFQNFAKPGTAGIAVVAGEILIALGIAIALLAITGLLGRMVRARNKELRKAWRK